MPIVIAFLGGMLTLLSPCTLPVIPLIFASVRSNRRYLLLMLSGMVLMFTAVSLLVMVAGSWVASLTEAGRWLALLSLALAGASLISSRVAQRLTAPAVALGNRINASSYRYAGGTGALLAGLGVGLLWAPCAGPVLGAILSLGFIHGSTVKTGLLLLAYGSGCALMLALLWLFGSRLIGRLRRGLGFSERLRQLAGMAMLAAVILIASGEASFLQGANGLTQRLEQRLSAGLPPSERKLVRQPIVAPAPTSEMPALEGGSAWINSPPLDNTSLKGKVVLIDFWTRDCINCQHTLPHVREWASKYREAGLVVVGVHTPEYPWERSLPALRAAVDKWQITYPIVADNGYTIWNAFGNQYWPAHYLFDAKGKLRYTTFGEGDYVEQEKMIQQLLQEARA